MPARLALWSVIYGLAYAVWPILWIVFTTLWLYNLCRDTGKIELLRRWMEHHASGDPCVQAILVAFCFGSLIEGTAGFGAPVAMTAFLLVGLGFKPRRAVIVSLISNTAPVAFGSLGIPIVALAGVTGLDLFKLASMVGRQIPLLSLILPAYLALVVGGQGFAAMLAGGAGGGRKFQHGAIFGVEFVGTLCRRHHRFFDRDRRTNGVFTDLAASSYDRRRWRSSCAAGRH